jgi:hypothetical protein
MLNTDGIEIKIPRKYEQDYYDICAEWEQKTQLILEHGKYDKLFIRDVNNYVGVTDYGGFKYKGAYIFDTEIWKDASQRIVPIAAVRALVNNVPVEETIRNHLSVDQYHDIKIGKKNKPVKAYGAYDFFRFVRAQSSPKKGLPELNFISVHNRQVIPEKLQKTNRYYVSKSGGKIIKQYKDGSKANIVAGPYSMKVCNFVDNSSDFSDIDYNFYINEAKKLVSAVQGKQINNNLTLF